MDKYEKRLRDATEHLIDVHDPGVWDRDDMEWWVGVVAKAQRDWDEALIAYRMHSFQSGYKQAVASDREKDIRWGRNLKENLG
jgi:hypothetical protein